MVGDGIADGDLMTNDLGQTEGMDLSAADL